MFKFHPLKWMSSIIVSKFLNSYLKQFDHNNIDLAFWEGQISLKNVVLRNDLLLQHGIQFQIIDSFIGNISVTIPWNNLKTQPIIVEITNAKIILSNRIDNKDLNKDQYQQQVNRIKAEILQKFDEQVQKEDNFSDGASGSNFIMDFFSKILEKFILKINDIDIIFIYEINNYEIVKFGFGFQNFTIQQGKQTNDDVKKHITITNIFLLFEFYDSVLPVQQESFIKDHTHSRFDGQKKIHILKNLGLDIDLGINFQKQLDLDIKLTTTPLLIYLKQRQIRLLLRALEDILNHRPDRPPKKAWRQWWPYIIKRIIEKEYIQTKVKKQAFTSYFWANRYVHAYTKKMLKQSTHVDTISMQTFEEKSTTSQILILRSMAVDKILEMRNLIRSQNPQMQQEQKGAQQWFKFFNSSFNMEHASNLRFSKKIVDTNLSFIKEKESNTRIALIVDIPKINILIQENQILQQLKNLHQQVNVFKQELKDKKSLQEKVLDHIKNNFLTKLSKIKAADDQKQDDWCLEELLKDKLLVNLEVQNIKLEFIQQGQFKKLIKAQLQNLTLYDMNKLNQDYNKIIELPEGLKLLISSEQLEREKKIMDLDPLEKTIQVHQDIQVGPVNLTLCKPLFERILSLQSLIFFETVQPRKENEEAQKYFNNFLRTTKRVQSNTNLSFTVSKINLYLPLKYNSKADMLLLHLKQIKIFKREHHNSMVNVYAESNPDGQVNQYLNQLKTQQALDRIQQVQQLDDSHNLKPLFFSIGCLRLAFVDEYDWEEKENLFLIQYRKLRGNQIIDGDPGIETIIETLPIKVRMEESQQQHEIGYMKDKKNFKKKIFPLTNNLQIQLPFLDIKISIKHLYQLQQIAAVWSTKGYDFYDVFDYKESRRNDFKRFKDLEEKLENFKMSEVQVLLDGLQFQLIVNTQEFLIQRSTQSDQCHENRLLTVNLLDLVFTQQTKYFESIQNLTIKTLIVQNNNCHKFKLLQPLKKLASNLLSQGDNNSKKQDEFGDQLIEALKEQSEIQEVEQNVSPTVFQKQQKMPSINETVITQEAFNHEPYIEEFWGNSQCKDCFNKNYHRLLVNFQKSDNQPDIQFQKLNNLVKRDKKPIGSEIDIQLQQVNLITDPSIFEQLRLILDIGSVTGDFKMKRFTKWMRINGFWPDFNDVNEKKKQDINKSVYITKEQTDIHAKTFVVISQVTIMMIYEEKLVYVFNLQDLNVNILSCDLSSKTHIVANKARLFDTAPVTGYHTTILEDYKSSNQIDITLHTYFNEDLIAIKQCQSYCGIRIKDAQLVFLKRITNELQYYVRKVLLKSFANNITQEDKENIWNNIKNQSDSFINPQIEQQAEGYGFKFSLVALDSMAIAYRNSLADEALYVKFSKIGFWFTGRWGNKYDTLIQTGQFDFELENEADQELEEKPEFFEIRDHLTEEFKTAKEQPLQYIQIVNVWGLEIRCCPDEEEKDIFIQAKKEDVALEVEIIFVDETFDQAIKPMRINVALNKVKIYAYDLDYCTMVKLFMENLGEQCQTIFGPYVYDEKNENFWMILDISIDDAIAKFFKGRRQDLEEHLKPQSRDLSGDGQNQFLYKNAASVAFAKIKDLSFQFQMKENGGKLMKLTIQQLDLMDFRETSVGPKQVLFGRLPDNPNDEENEFDQEYNNIDNISDSEDEASKKKQEEKIFIQRQQQEQKDSGRDSNVMSRSTTNQPTSRWERFKRYVKTTLCCARKQKLRKISKRSTRNQQSGNIDMEVMNTVQESLLNYVEPMFERRWINYRMKQALQPSIDTSKFEYSQHFKSNEHYHQPPDLLYLMTTKPDGEKLIKIKLQNKNIILLVDFLVETVQFFRTPFNGSDSKEYQRQPYYNNYPPMVIEVNASNVWAQIIGQDCLGIQLFVKYSQVWSGDSWYGPGSCTKNIDATLQKLVIFKHGQDYTDYFNNRSLIDPFKVSIVMDYSIDFFRTAINKNFITEQGVSVREYYKDLNKFESKNLWTVKLINSRRLSNNFSLSIRDVKQLQEIFSKISQPSAGPSDYKFQRPQQPVYDLVDQCLNVKKIVINNLSIQILKNKDGIKVAQFKLTKFNMQDRQETDIQDLRLVATIELDYFNKRKLDYEPAIEPWQFKITMNQLKETPPENKNIKRNAKRIKLSNRVDKSIKGDEVPFYLKDHQNSLNINITTAFIEVALEASKIYNLQMKDEEPYKIFNRSGYGVLLKDHKKDQVLYEIEKNSTKTLQSENRQKSLLEQQQMLVNMILLTKVYETEKIIQMEEEPPSPRRTQKFNITSNNFSTTINSKSANKKGQNLSNYKAIKYVNFDFVGKKFYTLDRQHKNENQERANKQKGTMDFLRSKIDNLTDAFQLTNNKKINEDRNLYIQVSVNINPQNGSKEIMISSTVKFYNYLHTPIMLGFLVNGQMEETLEIILRPHQLFVIPLEFLENKTEVRFTPLDEQDQEKRNPQIEHSYYQLDNLLCDQCPISDFEIDKDNTIIEVLEEAKGYATSNRTEAPQNIIKSEFKSIQDPLNYKNDFVISSYQKSNVKQKNFYFILTCVKAKYAINNQKYISEKKHDDDLHCYETFLVCYPIFKFSNAIVREITLHYGAGQKNPQQGLQNTKNLKPTESFVPENLDYSDDLEINFSLEKLPQRENQANSKKQLTLDVEQVTEPFKVFQKKVGFGDNNNKFSVQSGQYHLYIFLKKRSQKSREMVLYCPYLIFNETDRFLLFREHGITQDITSNDQIYYFHQTIGGKTSRQKKDYEQHSYYHNLHMFCTSSNMTKIQIAIGNMNRFQANQNLEASSFWSNPVSLQSGNIIEIIGSQDIFRRDTNDINPNKRNVTKGRFEFGMKVASAPGIFFRSKLITITPRFIVHNETDRHIALAQVETEYVESNILRLKPQDWKYYNWPNIKKPNLVMISYYQQSTGLIAGWSGFFKIQVQDIALKIPFPKQAGSQGDNQQMYFLQKVNITLMDDLILLIRFTQEDVIIPPYYIENLTKYEITFRQKSAQSYRYQPQNPNSDVQNNEINKGTIMVQQNNKEYDTLMFAAGGNDTTTLQPGEKVAFTWDNWIDDKEHVIEVEIEGKNEKYEIDKIQNFPPIILPSQGSKKNQANKKYLYKQGLIYVKRETDDYQIRYVTLNVIKQKLNIYTTDKKSHESYRMQGAKVEESKDKEFILRIDPDSLVAENLYFEAQNTIEEQNEWVDYFWRAILINKPEQVELKIEPSNQTKVVSFFQNISNNIFIKDEELTSFDWTLTSYKISIKNCIGISLIDDSPKEIIQVSIKNIQIEYSLLDEYARDQSNKILMEDEENNNNAQQSTYVVQEKTYIKILKNYITIKVDLIIINNQIINSQFPVLLAPNKKKLNLDQQPFLMFNIFKKDQQLVGSKKNQNLSAVIKQNQSTTQQQNYTKSKISYIHTFSMFADTLEIRLDHQILDSIIQLSNQIRVLISDSSMKDDDNMIDEDPIYKLYPQFNFKSLQSRLEQELQNIVQHSESKIYLKNLLLEPIDICFTLKSSPGHTMNTTSNNVIADFGLTLASIDSAKIRLNSFKTQHIFGSQNEIIGRISKHYQGQFLTQIYKLLGSFELFGSPVSLISNLGTGVIDMFYEPFYALVTGKSGYKAGEKFFTGAVTLIHTSITGVYKTVNKILGTIMRLLDRITLDKKYMAERSNRLNRTIKNFKEGIIIGFTNFGKILISTVIGILGRPITGLQEDGLLGFLLGIYQGIMGVIIKPTVGLYDLLTTIIDGIKNTAVYEEHIMDTRYRPPRIFGEDNQLIKFDFKDAIGTDIIRRFKLKKFDGETILFFDQLNITKPGSSKKIEAQIVLTDIRIVYILTHSSIHCDKIMVYKIHTVKYKAKKQRLSFQFHTPIRKTWYSRNSRRYTLDYDNHKKASKLIEEMKRNFNGRYEINYII